MIEAVAIEMEPDAWLGEGALSGSHGFRRRTLQDLGDSGADAG